MLELNKIYQMDCLEGLMQLDDNSIDLIITSPPYNKGINGKNNKGPKWNKTIDYNGDINNDNMPEDEYEKWQIEILNECFRVLKPEGSMFYNHKNRIHSGKGEIISPYQWLLKTKFKIRQEIIWDRGSTQNVNRRRYLPTTELIFWLTKTSNPKFDRKQDTLHKNEIWSFRFEKGTDHPAPYPIDLPDNIIHCIQESNNDKLIVLDPFMGSGTTALSALKHNCNYIGFEKFSHYIRLCNERIKKLSI
jgi:modification methylase